MMRLAFGAKWSEVSAPLDFGEGFIAASAPKRSRRKRLPSAMAPRPVVLRARNARRLRVCSMSDWRNMVESGSRSCIWHLGIRDPRRKTHDLLFGYRLVQVE